VARARAREPALPDGNHRHALEGLPGLGVDDLRAPRPRSLGGRRETCVDDGSQSHAHEPAAESSGGRLGCHARGLALIIVHPIPGQEERNADHLLEAGAAIRCNNLPALAWKIDRLLADPAHLAEMQANARRLARPHAARDIAMALLEAEPGG